MKKQNIDNNIKEFKEESTNTTDTSKDTTSNNINVMNKKTTREEGFTINCSYNKHDIEKEIEYRKLDSNEYELLNKYSDKLIQLISDKMK